MSYCTSTARGAGDLAGFGKGADTLSLTALKAGLARSEKRTERYGRLVRHAQKSRVSQNALRRGTVSLSGLRR